MPISRSAFREAFRVAVCRLGLPSTLKFYSLRRGGATAHFQQCGRLDLTAEIGRWNDLRTARIYINTGVLEVNKLRYLNNPRFTEYANAYISLIDVELIKYGRLGEPSMIS